jgi:hypothetical protein
LTLQHRLVEGGMLEQRLAALEARLAAQHAGGIRQWSA